MQLKVDSPVFASILPLIALAACQPAPAPHTLLGALRHHSQQVKSVEAWHGTEFTVDGQAVLASDKVSRDLLLKHVGQTVEVTGRMEVGEPWTPDASDLSSHPVSGLDLDGSETVRRGGGIRLLTLRRLTP